MSKFRQFLKKHPIFEFEGGSYVTGTAYSGPLDLPDLKIGNIAHVPGERPVGGFSNLSQVATTGVDRHRYADLELFHRVETLQKLGVLANNVMIIIQQKDPAQEKMTMRYRLAQFDQLRNYIVGLPLRGMISDGGYPELRPQDIDMGWKMKIIIPDPTPPSPQVAQQHGLANADFYAIDITALKTQMEQMHQFMRQRERGYDRLKWAAQKADDTMNLASQGGMVQTRKMVNPLAGN